MICLYDKMATEFEDNGLCVLDPSVCTVSEETCGSYELYMEHPFDKSGKYLMLAENMIIQAPIPHTVIPSVTLPETIIYTVSTVGPFWKKMPVARHKKAEQDNLSFIRNNSTNYQWNQHKSWNKDGYAVYGGVIYKANKFVSGDQTPLQNPDAWTRMGTVSGSASDDSNYVPGEEYSPALESGQRVRRLGAVSDTVIQIRDPLGRVGYYQLSNLTQDTIEAETLPAQVIDKQLFRIYSVESEEETHVIKVSARHISYDFSGNTLLDCKLEDTTINDAVAVFQGNLMIPDNRRIACEFEGNKITKDWSYKNPVNALLDPDDGLVAELKARLIRNNRDYFILKNTNPRKGPTIEYGVNLQGVTWNRNVETVITRVVPRCSDKADGYIYLESGGTWDSDGVWVANNDIYVDSPIASNYPFPRIEVLDAGFSVGDKYTPAGSKNEVERTTQNCREEMLKQAKERFTVDHCDAPEITLDVEFTLLGDTEQYKQYKDLQRVNLYDQLTIKTEAYEATAQVTSYEFDCLTGRYNSITVGDVSSFNKRVPGYRVVNESITYAKLAPDLISRIRTMDSKSGSSTGSGSGGTPGTGYDNSSVVSPNSKDEAGIVSKGGTNYNKVWKTDSEGNPAWRDESGSGSVTDNNPTLAFGSQSTVATIDSTDIHVTMPGAADSAKTLLNAMNDDTGTLGDNDSVAEIGSSTNVYKVKLTKIWDYIKGKISSVLGLTDTAYDGKAATAGDADTVNGKTVETNVPANAVFTDTVTEVVDALNNTSTAKALSANQGKVLNDGKVDKSGDTMTGSLTVSSGYIYNVNGFRLNESDKLAIHYGKHTNGRGAQIVEYKQGDTSKYEAYRLPAIATDISTSDIYNILTTKSPVTIAQGGTNATTAADALTNLGAVAKSGDTMTGSLTISGANISANKGYYAGTATTSTADTSLYSKGALEIREAGRIGNANNSAKVAPRIGFHWSNTGAGSLALHKDATFHFMKQNGTDHATLYANLPNPVNNWQLYDASSVPTSETTITLTDSRKYNDFQILGFVIVYNDIVRNTLIVPYWVFHDCVNLSIPWVDSLNVQRYVDVTWVSDTKSKIKKSSNASATTRLIIYGFGMDIYPS